MSGRSPVRVKICGITNEEDAHAAISAGASALGFNTWRDGKRYLDLSAAGDWIAALPPFITKVALLVNATLDEAAAIARLPYIDALQLHGDETLKYCREASRFGRPLIKALRVRTASDLDGLEEFPTRHFLIDAHVAGHFGGTGASADLDLAREFQRRYPKYHLVLAGGLKPENVGVVLREVQPWAVDVSSGVESAPGKKDAAKMRDFMAAVRAGESV